MQNTIYSSIQTSAHPQKRQLAVLIDPDKSDKNSIVEVARMVDLYGADMVLVGGSLITGNFLEHSIEILKDFTQVPVVLFPGNSFHISRKADGILLLSLISGRNPELLIGSHVVAAPVLKDAGLEIMPTGYMLIESGKLTSVVYMSNTTPIPSNKNDIALCTALAGEMLGMKLIYMDAGSGAHRPVPQEMIRYVKNNISIPLIVGGGITSVELARNAWQAGADVVVVGNALEKEPGFIKELCLAKDELNKVQVR